MKRVTLLNGRLFVRGIPVDLIAKLSKRHVVDALRAFPSLEIEDVAQALHIYNFWGIWEVE